MRLSYKNPFCKFCETEHPLTKKYWVSTNPGYWVCRARRNQTQRVNRHKNKSLPTEESRVKARAYAKAWRARNREKISSYEKAKNVEKLNIRRITRRAIKKGLLLKRPCEVCGDFDVQAHHFDYNQPLKISWLCQKHHLAWHRLFEAIDVLG